MNTPTSVPTAWHTVPAVPVRWMDQFLYFQSLFEKIRDVRGDIVECGLGEGATFSMLAYFTGREQYPHRQLWGYDSFEGWPEPDPCDASPRNPKKGEWTVPEAEVRKRLEDTRIFSQFPDLVITLTKGFLADTLPTAKVREIAFLHIDVDLYAGYRDALAYLFSKVAPGGIIAFDEYLEYPMHPPYHGKIEKWPGCTTAVDEFFLGRPETISYHPGAGKYYTIKI